MPIKYLSALTAVQRSARTNRHFGVTLAFVAGALNAGGFLAIGQHTSHMTGFVSSAADHLVLGFNYLGFSSAIPLAVVLAAIALAPNLEAPRMRM